MPTKRPCRQTEGVDLDLDHCLMPGGLVSHTRKFKEAFGSNRVDKKGHWPFPLKRSLEDDGTALQ